MFTVFGLASKAIGTDYNAQYLHWIYWVNNPNHVGTADELSEIAFVLNEGNVQPNKEYKLSTGITYKIPMPNLYLSYLVRVYRKVDPTTTSDNVYLKIKKSDETYWDNNLNMTVTNYYFSSVHKEVRSIPNYSGKDDQSPILIYNGYPVIKRDCGNPLEN